MQMTIIVMSDGEELISHKKRRLQNACDQCRSRKIKCDSARMPGNTCSPCTSFKLECTHVAASAKKKRGPPKGTPRGQRTVKSIVSSILSDSYQPPTESAAIHKLLSDFAEHIRALDEEVSLLREQLNQSHNQSHNTLSPLSVMAPSTGTPNSQTSSKDVLLTVNSMQISTAPPGSYLDSDVHAIEGISEHFRRITFANAKDRHFGGSSSLMLVKTAIDIKNEFSDSSAASRLLKDSNCEGDVGGAESEYKRPEFWTIHPWQILPEDKTPPFVFPDEDLIDSLVTLYFTHVNAYFSILHEPSFIRSITQDLHHKDRHFGALVLAVCALGARFSDDERIYEDGIDPTTRTNDASRGGASEQSIGWKWIRQIQPVRRTFTAPPSIYEIQLYQIYVFFMQATSTPEICWILVSIGVRFAQDVGAHRKKQGNVKPTLESEMWKRAFWMLYVMDIFTSAFLGRPRSIGMEDFDIDLPIDCDDEYWENPDKPEQAFQQPPGKPTRVSYTVCFIQLMDILALAMRTIYSIRKSDMWTKMGMSALQWNEKIVAELDSSLNKWIDELPEHLRWDPTRENPEHFNQSVMLYTTYYWVQIQIHRPFIARPGESSVLSFPSLAICANAARSCCHVMEVQRRRNAKLLTMPNLLMALFSSSLVLLVNVWQGRRLRGAGKDIEKELADVHRCINLLGLHENRWQQAGRFCDILREIIAISHFHHDRRLDSESRSMKRSREAALGDAEAETLERASSISSEKHDERQIASNSRVSTTKTGTTGTAGLTDSMQSPKPAGPDDDSLFESMSLLPTHSSELGRLPIYESFTDQSLDEQWSFDVPMASLFNPLHDSTWLNDNSRFPELIQVPEVSQAADSQNLLYPQDSSGGSSATSVSQSGLDDIRFGLDVGDSLNTRDSNYSNASSEWDDWGRYMASVDEVLQSMNPRV
ncbi:fungal-specific transcription factor domain-containing protein [Lentinula aff. detonsa]|nr:fungal-specific transcription factor domain-containing protein [Lentinula aff. detonsa]